MLQFMDIGVFRPHGVLQLLVRFTAMVGLSLPWALHSATPVQQQLDSLIASAQGKRIGLITNPSGCDEAGNLDATYILNSGVTISTFFAPEHGLRGDLPPGVTGGDYIDPQTGIPVYAVYG